MEPLGSPPRRTRAGGIGVSTVAVGLALGLLYVTTAAVTYQRVRMPARPLYDGLAPPIPYYWVQDPRVDDNPQFLVGAAPGRAVVALSRRGSEPASAATDDGQAALALPQGAVPPRESEVALDVLITPLDAGVLPPPPRGTRFNGNAYRIEIRYARSKTPAVLRRSITVILRYPTFATQILRLTDAGWVPLATNSSPASLQVYAETTALSTFIATAPPGVRPPITRRALPFVIVEVILALSFVFLAVFFLQDWFRRSRRFQR